MKVIYHEVKRGKEPNKYILSILFALTLVCGPVCAEQGTTTDPATGEVFAWKDTVVVNTPDKAVVYMPNGNVYTTTATSSTLTRGTAPPMPQGAGVETTVHEGIVAAKQGDAVWISGIPSSVSQRTISGESTGVSRNAGSPYIDSVSNVNIPAARGLAPSLNVTSINETPVVIPANASAEEMNKQLGSLPAVISASWSAEETNAYLRKQELGFSDEKVEKPKDLEINPPEEKIIEPTKPSQELVSQTQKTLVSTPKNYFGKYVSGGSNGVVESVERIDYKSTEGLNPNTQQVYIDDRGVPLSFFNEKGETISKEDMLKGSRERMEKEKQEGGTGRFFEEGYIRDSEYYSRLTAYNPATPNAQNQNTSAISAPTLGTTILRTPMTLQETPVSLSVNEPTPTVQSSSSSNRATAKQGAKAVKAKVVKAPEPVKALVSYEKPPRTLVSYEKDREISK